MPRMRASRFVDGDDAAAGEHRVEQAAADDLTVAADVLDLVEVGLRDDADDHVGEAHDHGAAADHRLAAPPVRRATRHAASSS